MARLTCSVRVVQLRIESRLWMEKLEALLVSASGRLQRGMRLPVKVRKGPVTALVGPPAFAVPCQKCSVDHQPASPQPEAERCVGNQSMAT